MSSKTLIASTIAIEVAKKIQNDSHGIILMNLPVYDYFTLIEEVQHLVTSSPLYFFVGFTADEVNDLKKYFSELKDLNNIFYSVEEAEKYRHDTSIAGTRIVIVKRQIPKLSSLLWYEQISTTELYKQLCIEAQELFVDTNEAIISLWKVIDTKPLKSIFSFEQIVSYFENLKNNKERITSEVTRSMYLLGLLPDITLLDSPKNENIRKKILENSRIVQRLRFLDKGDLKVLQSIDDNLTTQEKILAFYKTRNNSLLKDLSLENVIEILSSVNKSKKSIKRNSVKTDPDSVSSHKGKGDKNDSTGVGLILDNNEEVIEDIINNIDEEFENWEKGKKTRVHIETDEGIKTNVDFIPEIYALTNTFIADNTFGGIIETAEKNAQDALLNINKSKVTAFTEEYLQDIFEKLEAIKDEYPEEAEEIIVTLNNFIIQRKKLTSAANRLADSPMLKVSDNTNEEKLYTTYLEIYSRLISLLKEHYQKFLLYSAVGTKEIIAQINSLDTIFIKSPDSIHAVLSPLNPLYLWKYVELGHRIRADIENLDEADKGFLIRTADEIPNPLITIFISSFISNDKDEVIVEVGKIGNLPLYSSENFINQSTDGLEVIKNSLKKFISVYKHSKVGLKIAMINPPDLEDLLKVFTNVIPNEVQGLQVDIYKTKETPYSWANTENIDEDILKLFSNSNRFLLRIHNEISTFDKLNDKLKKRPYHLTVLFDPSKRSITEVKTESRLNLKIHPLCIPKVFQYDPVTDKLDIVPATSGNIFTDHHELVARLNDRPKGWHNTVVANLEPLKENLQAMMDCSEWLLIADNNLKNFEVSTIGSEKCIFYSGSQTREVGIYSNNWSKLIRGLDGIIRQIGNYIPNEECLGKLLSQIQLLNEKSILSLINVSSSTTFDTNKSKGTIGSAIASAWYKDKFENSILASLDTDLARNWLKNREDNTVSDLIGIRQITATEAIVDVIEIKTHDTDFQISSEQNLDGTKDIKGHAADQANIINKLINEVLFEQSKITSISRRELLRFQVFKILHSSNFSKAEKKKWTLFLNNLFSNNLKQITINSAICFVNFNSNETSDVKGTTYSSELPITLYQINNDLITRYISKCSDLNSNTQSQEDVNAPKSEKTVSDLENNQRNHYKETSSVLEINRENSEVDTKSDKIVYTANTLESNTILPKAFSDNKGIMNNSAGEDLWSFITHKAKAIQQAMKDYSIDVQEVDPQMAMIAARFIRFRIKLRPGEKLSRIDSVKSDIGREIEAINEIFVGNERGSNYIYLDVPRESADNISLLEHINEIPKGNIGNLNVLLGQDPSGEMVFLDLAKAPHLLTAGSTGSGKTIFLYSIIVSLIHQYNSEELELVIIDPKQTDFIYFEDLPHLRNYEVIIEPEAAVSVLNELVEKELQARTDLLRESRNRDLFTYNEKNPQSPMRPILVIVDEYADLIAAADLEGNKADFERNMIRLAQRSRNVGIHLVIATQRPSADIVTSRLKANVPTRISFSLPANQDSRTILDATGAEDLLGKGDMLYSYNGDIRRLQGLFINEDDLQEYIKKKFQ